MYIDHSGMNAKQSRELMDSIQLEHQTMQSLKYGREKSLSSVVHVVVMNGMIVNPKTGLVYGIVYYSPIHTHNLHGFTCLLISFHCT